MSSSTTTATAAEGGSPVYALGSTNNEFAVTMLNDDNPNDLREISLEHFTEMSIVFRRPDHVEIQRPALPRDVENLDTNGEIYHVDEEGILVQRGYWEYWGTVLYGDGARRTSHQRQKFFVK